MDLIGWVIFLVALLFSVMLHETGHFVTAKKFGMKVTRYFVGFGPTLWSTRRGETEYGIKALPVGGFVKIIGMHSLDDVDDPADEPRSFRRQPAWQRIVVLCAGSFMHFVLAFLLIFGLALGIGIENDNTTQLGTISTCVAANTAQLNNGTCTASDQASPAKLAGLRLGDQVTAFNGKPVSNWTQLGNAIRKAPAGSAGGHHGEARRPDADPARHAGHGQRRAAAPTWASRRPSCSRRPTRSAPSSTPGSAFGQVLVGSAKAVAALPGALPKLFSKDRGSTAARPGEQRGRRGRGDRRRGRGQRRLAVQGQLRAAADRLAEHLRRRLQHAPAAAAGRRARRGRRLGADPGLVRPAARRPDPGLVDMAKLLPVSFSIFVVLMFFGVAADPGRHREPGEYRRLTTGANPDAPVSVGPRPVTR